MENKNNVTKCKAASIWRMMTTFKSFPQQGRMLPSVLARGEFWPTHSPKQTEESS
jgi:hypothetical protein